LLSTTEHLLPPFISTGAYRCKLSVLQALQQTCAQTLRTPWCCCLTPQDVRRAGEHTVPPDALKLLLWELHGALLAVLQQLLHTSNSITATSSNSMRPGSAGPRSGPRALTEKGVLQLLFDQRFMRDVLGGGRPLEAVTVAAGGSGGAAGHAAAANGDAGGDLAARKRSVSNLEQQLQVSSFMLCCHHSNACLLRSTLNHVELEVAPLVCVCFRHREKCSFQKNMRGSGAKGGAGSYKL
jgi:hypothetical protein